MRVPLSLNYQQRSRLQCHVITTKSTPWKESQMAVHKPESFKCNPFGGATWIMRSTKGFISCGLYWDKSLWYFHNLATAIKKKTKKQKRNSLCPVMSPAPSALLEKSLHSIPSRPTQEMTPTTIWLRCSEWKVDQLRKALASETPIYTRAINPNHSSPSKVKAVILRGNAFLTSNYAPPTTNA